MTNIWKVTSHDMSLEKCNLKQRDNQYISIRIAKIGEHWQYQMLAKMWNNRVVAKEFRGFLQN